MKFSIIVLLVVALAMVVDSLWVPPFAESKPESNELDETEARRSLADTSRVRRQTALDCKNPKPLYPTDESDDDLSSEEEASEDYNPKPRNGCQEVTNAPPTTSQSTAPAAAESVDESNIAKEAGNDVSNGTETRVRRAVMQRRRGCKGGRKNRRGRKNKRKPNGRGGFVVIETVEITFDATECGPKETPASSNKTTQPSTTTVASSPAADDDSQGGPRIRRQAKKSKKRRRCLRKLKTSRGTKIPQTTTESTSDGDNPNATSDTEEIPENRKAVDETEETTTNSPNVNRRRTTARTRTTTSNDESGDESSDDEDSSEIGNVPGDSDCNENPERKPSRKSTNVAVSEPKTEDGEVKEDSEDEEKKRVRRSLKQKKIIARTDESLVNEIPIRIRRQAQVKRGRHGKKCRRRDGLRRRFGRNAPLYRPAEDQQLSINSINSEASKSLRIQG